MHVLTVEELPIYTMTGLKAICSENRDIIGGYSQLRRNEVKQMLTNLIRDGNTIYVPPFVTTQSSFYRKYKS
jgi:hypothetical protein